MNYLESGDENRKLCSLYLSLLQRMDARQDRFGDAFAPLTGLCWLQLKKVKPAKLCFR